MSPSDGTLVNSLQLDLRPSDPFLVLTATGELDLHTLDEFERIVGQWLGTSSVIVDLSRLDFLAISALRSLLVCQRLAGTTGHSLYYAGASAQTRRLLTVSGLDAVLPMVSSVRQVLDGSAVSDGVADQTFRNLAELDVG